MAAPLAPLAAARVAPAPDPRSVADRETVAGTRGAAAPARNADAPPGTRAARTDPDPAVAAGEAERVAVVATALGPLRVAWNGLGIRWADLEPADDPPSDRRSAGRPVHAAAALPPDLAGPVGRRLAGDERDPIPLDLRGGTPFEVAVWRALLGIPRGEVRSYAWVAAAAGRPRAVRAAGTAVGRNPVPVLVPCHRVVRSDGRLGEFSLGGPAAKRALLAAEGVVVVAAPRARGARGARRPGAGGRAGASSAG